MLVACKAYGFIAVNKSGTARLASLKKDVKPLFYLSRLSFSPNKIFGAKKFCARYNNIKSKK